tara:strand:- start:458 stop:703 length:246 start_codon:yes stop_codon:yes gene_type:complete
MKEYFSGDEIKISSIDAVFKVKIVSGTASIQAQVANEGFDEITEGNYTQTADGVITIKECTIKPILTGDARFFMSSTNNRP